MTISSVTGAELISEGVLAPLGYQQIATGLSTATSLTLPTTTPRIALIQAEGADVRWRDDGTNPTGSVGMPLASGRDFIYTGTMTAIKFIASSTAAILNVCYYR